jgi:hypothetical protein
MWSSSSTISVTAAPKRPTSFPSSLSFGIKTTSLTIIALVLMCLGALYQNGTINDTSSTSIINNIGTVKDKDASSLLASNAEHVDVERGVKGIAWLMSFPNSGTSYTILLTNTITGTATATNYVPKSVSKNLTEYKNIFRDYPVPRWSLQEDVGVNIQIPTTGYVLTKTHCGGYCFRCFAGRDSGTLKNSKDFFKECRRGSYISKNNMTSGQLDILDSYTPKESIKRAVHLIRDPFDNVVARFHLHRKKFSKQLLDKYPNTLEGFRDYCNNDLGKKYRTKETSFLPFKDIYGSIKNVPCHSDFFRYIQWHNLAFETTARQNLSSMIIHYERYTDNFNKTKDDLLQFLEQREVNKPPTFITGKTYRNYYTDKENAAVKLMFSKLANNDTWDQTKQYFD